MDVKEFLGSPSAAQWKKLGAKRRAGVAVPLFFVQSRNSVGVGELPDLELLADWCAKTGLSIIQLLPMNDTGFDFRPYDAQSSFALEPMFLSLEKLAHAPAKSFAADIAALRKRFPLDTPYFDTAVKREKLKLLKRMYLKRDAAGDADFHAFQKDERAWLGPYAFFKVIKARQNGASWEDWPAPLKDRDPAALEEVRRADAEALEFEMWVQWQLYRQFRDAAAAVRKKGVHLLGDLPFLVSRDSADVWSRREYFKLDLSAGAPPDLYFADGQKWGMPPYHWGALEAGGYDYFEDKLRYAENFYDLYRIDHFVGIFRVWVFPRAGGDGFFDPPDESQWEGQGKRIVSKMLEETKMLPCAEDLGTVPDCSYRVLKEYGIPGMEIQRWMRDWGNSWDFKTDGEYRVNAIATLSTHDMAPFREWWEFEAGRVDTEIFRKKCAGYGLDGDALAARLFDLDKSVAGRAPWKKEIDSPAALSGIPELDGVLGLMQMAHLSTYDEKDRFWKAVGLSGKAEEKSSELLVNKALEMAGKTASVFCIHPLQDWLSLGSVMGGPSLERRINLPGTVDEKNWRFRMPLYLEDLERLPINASIRRINEASERVS